MTYILMHLLGDYFRVMWHGLPLDLSLAGYLTAIPGILLIASAWTNSSILRRIRQGYFGVIAFVMACIFIIDLGLYGFWGFRSGCHPRFLFLLFPQDAMASVSFWFVLLGILSMLIYAAILYFIFYCVLIREKKPLKIPYRRQNVSLALLLLTAALFIPIRGGFSVSTMNLSKVYFSQDQRMNHAAINPAFSFMYSATHQNNFDKYCHKLPEIYNNREYEPCSNWHFLVEKDSLLPNHSNRFQNSSQELF